MNNYLSRLILTTIASLGVFLAFNWFVDPFWIWDSPQVKHINLIKPYIHNNQRIFETNRLLRFHPEALILGTSREDLGIDPRHPAFANFRTFNAAISSQPYMESKELLRAISDKGNAPRLVVFGLIYEHSYLRHARPPDDFTKDNFSDGHRLDLLFNASTLKFSLRTVAGNLWEEDALWRITLNGFSTNEYWTHIPGSQRVWAKKSERYYVFMDHEVACKNTFVAGNGKDQPVSPMEDLREAIAIAYRKGIDMRLFIGPAHARQWETLVASGLWGQFEEWKRMLIAMVEMEAIKAHAKPFPVWDFSGYNSVTEENFPPEKDTSTRMRFYFESCHYTPATGDLVLDRIFNLSIPGRSVPDDFGVLLTKDNINSHLANIRRARERYRQTNPEDVAEIESLAREAATAKPCQSVK